MMEQRCRRKYPDEMRERAVRMVFEAQRYCGSHWEAIASVAEKLGPTPETVGKWVRRTEINRVPRAITKAVHTPSAGEVHRPSLYDVAPLVKQV